MQFDSRVENCFKVTSKEGRVTRYPCNERGLYVKLRKVSVVNATTVEGFTQREVDGAVRARKLYHDVGAENISNVKMWVRSNQAKNVPVTVKDLNLSDKIFKTDVATCKGKSTRPKSSIVSKSDIVELPPKLRIQGRKIELAIDVVCINNESFLHSVDRLLKRNGLVVLGTRKKDESYTKKILYEGLDKILKFYNRADIYISMIHCDNEFKSILKDNFHAYTVLAPTFSALYCNPL